MFGGSRRHRQANQPLTAATANPNAATAAASAFARRASTSSLSSAAAAAALRARPTTPINVAEVQTKRTQKRSASVSSHGSQDGRRGLQRSPSQGSMAERTFRSPSPHRTPAAPEEAPPVPTIPDGMRSNGGKSTHARATSLQMQPFRVASQKKKDGAGSWFGAATEGNLANVRTSDAPMRVTSLESRPGAVSPTSSINFSYPRGLHGASPPASPTVESIRMTNNQRHASPRRTESVDSRATATSDQSLVYDPNSRRMIPKADLLARERGVRDASEKPIKKKTKHQQQQVLSRSGSHLAKGTVGRVQGAAVEAEEPAPKQRQQPQPQVPTLVPEQKTLQSQPSGRETSQSVSVPTQVKEHLPVTPEPSPPRSPTPDQPINQPAAASPEPNRQQSVSSPELEPPVVQDVRKSDGATILPHSEPRQGAPILGRKPSTVQEESEDEDSDENFKEPADQHDVANVLDAVPMRSTAPPKWPSLSSESTVVDSPATVSSQRHPSPPEQRQYGNVRNARAHSSSPGRSARFALGTDQLVIRHEPPPRSVSPRKSAMKHSTSPSRGASPSDESSEASGPSRVGSEATAVEAPVARKKSVRVSFDDENTKVVGHSAAKPELDSPVPPSPQQTKRHWYSHLGRSRKKDLPPLDDDEVMKPRPALPSFGSIRDKKPRETEERPLVRPIEPPSPAGVVDTSPSQASSDRNDEVSTAVGQSNDHNIGAILNQEQTARNAANISRFREPLPPVVTSMEGSGYYSPSTTSSEDEDDEIVQEPEPTLPPEQVKEEILATHPELVDNATPPAAAAAPVHQHEAESSSAGEDVPSISIIQPTPTSKDTEPMDSSGPSGHGYFDVPGGFPEDETEDNTPRPRTQPELSEVNKDQQKQTSVPNQRVVSFASSTQATRYRPLVENSESSSGESIYSDAYEDHSEADGDGFMSLDAVITTPIPDKVSQKLFEKAMAAPSQDLAKDFKVNAAPPESESSQIADPSQPEEEWEKAKMFWRGLTSEKRRQLEREALEEAGAEGDLEEVVQPKKVKRKKSVRRSEQAMQEQMPSTSDRVYQIPPGTRVVDEEDRPSTMRKSLRGRHPQEDAPGNAKFQKTMWGAQTQASVTAGAGMRKTLRSDPSAASGVQTSEQSQSPGGMRKSMRQTGSSQADLGPQARTNAAVGSRPLSLQGPQSTRQGEDKRAKHTSLDASMSSTEMARAMHSTLRRRASDSSESSFRRSRPRREGFGFRKSMRSSAAPDASTAGRNSRFSLRSASPPGSPPVSMGTRMTMRSTMRSDSSDGSTRRMRLPSFSKSSAKTTAGKSGHKSRFGDSSDEEDAVQPAFRSRFADSSDDEVPSPLPATQGMPKSMRTSSSAAAAAMKVPPPRYNEKGEESPDLPDSSDEEQPPVQQQKSMSPRQVSGASGRLVKSQSDSHGLHRSGSGRGALVESSSTPAMGIQVLARPSQHRRGSFLSVLRRRKETDIGKISRPMHAESAARTGTKLERGADEISALRGEATSPKLQRQPMDNWPLAEETIDDEKRPMSADNTKPMDASRSVFPQRRSTNQLTTARPGEFDGVQHEASGKKKKKFGTLRRMFKLDD